MKILFNDIDNRLDKLQGLFKSLYGIKISKTELIRWSIEQQIKRLEQEKEFKKEDK